MSCVSFNVRLSPGKVQQRLMREEVDVLEVVISLVAAFGLLLRFAWVDAFQNAQPPASHSHIRPQLASYTWQFSRKILETKQGYWRNKSFTRKYRGSFTGTLVALSAAAEGPGCEWCNWRRCPRGPAEANKDSATKHRPKNGILRG